MRLPLLVGTSYLQLLRTYSIVGYAKSTKKVLSVVINFCRFFSWSGRTLSHESIKGLIPIDSGYI